MLQITLQSLAGDETRMEFSHTNGSKGTVYDTFGIVVPHRKSVLAPMCARFCGYLAWVTTSYVELGGLDLRVYLHLRELSRQGGGAPMDAFRLIVTEMTDILKDMSSHAARGRSPVNRFPRFGVLMNQDVAISPPIVSGDSTMYAAAPMAAYSDHIILAMLSMIIFESFLPSDLFESRYFHQQMFSTLKAACPEVFIYLEETIYRAMEARKDAAGPTPHLKIDGPRTKSFVTLMRHVFLRLEYAIDKRMREETSDGTVKGRVVIEDVVASLIEERMSNMTLAVLYVTHLALPETPQ